MATLSNNDIIINYKLGDTSAINQLLTKFELLAKEEQDVVELARKLREELDKTGKSGGASTDKIVDNTEKMNKGFGNMTGTLKNVGAALVAAFSVSKILEFAKTVTDTTIKFEGYAKAIEFASGSTAAYAKNQVFLNNLIQKYGLDLRSTTEAYKSFLAASVLAGQSQQETNDQFLAVTKAATVLKLTTDQVQGAFLALGQMMSKGTVQAEELRGQLGERIPGAFSIMAKALGVNERQLNKMLEQGQVLSRDALPKFAAQLEKTFGPAAERNLNGLINAQNRFNSSIDNLMKTIGLRGNTLIEGFYERMGRFFNQISRAYETEQQKLERITGETYQLNIESVLKDLPPEEKKRILEAAEMSLGLLERHRKSVEKRLSTTKELTFGEQLLLSFGNTDLEQREQARILDQKKIESLKEQEAKMKGQIGALKEMLKLGQAPQQAAPTMDPKAIEDAYKKEIQLAETLQKVQLLIVKQTYTDKIDIMTQELLVREKFAAQMFAIDKKYADMGIDEAKRNSMTRLEIVKAERTETIKALSDITKSEKDEIQKRMEELNKFDADRGRAQQKSLEDQKQLTKEKAELDQKYAEAVKKIEENSAKETQQLKQDLGQMSVQEVEAFVNFAQTMTDGFFSIYQANLQNQMVAMNKQFDEEIRLADGNVQKITEINEKRAAKEREIRKKQFEAQQMQAIAQVIFNTAPLIAQYLAGVVTAPLAGIAIAAQAAQIGFILAQPVPEFAKGVENFEGGPAIVGEQGRELVRTDKGLFLTPDKATMTYLPKGSDVITAPKTRELLQGNSTFLNRQNQWTAIDTAPIAQAIKAIPVQSLEISERGLERYVTKGNRTTKILNKKRGANL